MGMVKNVKVVKSKDLFGDFDKNEHVRIMNKMDALKKKDEAPIVESNGPQSVRPKKEKSRFQRVVRKSKDKMSKLKRDMINAFNQRPNRKNNKINPVKDVTIEALGNGNDGVELTYNSAAHFLNFDH